MKNKELATSFAKYLVVDLPFDSRILWVKDNFIRIEFTVSGRNLPFEQNVLIPPGNYKFLGFLSSITEKEIGQLWDFDSDMHDPYESYVDIAKSHFEAHGITTVNPREKPFYDMDYTTTKDRVRRYNYELKKWTEAQSNLWLNPAIFLNNEVPK